MMRTSSSRALRRLSRLTLPRIQYQEVLLKRTFGYVPEAYRGVRNDDRELKRAEQKIKNKQSKLEGKFVREYMEFLRIATSYRSSFGQTIDVKPIVDPNQWKIVSVDKEQKPKRLEEITNQMRTIMKDIHQSGEAPIDLKQIMATEDQFRGLTMVLKHIAGSVAELYRDFDPQAEYIDIAERAVRDLSTLTYDRALLVKSVLNWEANRKQSPPTIGGRLQGWAASVFGEDKVTEKAVPENVQFAHDDPSVNDDQHVYRLVMRCIEEAPHLSRNGLDNVPSLHDDDESNLKKTAATATRLTGLLNAMPPGKVPDSDLVQLVLEALKKVGTLRSAEEAKMILLQYPSNASRIRFSPVLEAYYEAARRESGVNRQIAIREAINILMFQWDNVLPRHRMERIIHSTIILKCLALSDTKDMVGACQIGDKFVKRALGGTAYDALLEFVKTNKGTVEPQQLHLLSLRAQLYALTRSKDHLQEAMKMMECLVRHGREFKGKFVSFIDDQTLGALLDGIFYSSVKPNESVNKEELKASIDFCREVFHFMLSKCEIQCLPTIQNFERLFTLLADRRYKDDGSAFEELLSMIETREYLDSSSFAVPLSLYHKILKQLNPKENPSVADAAKRSHRILQRIEIVSTPLFLGDKEVRKASIPSLYNTNLRPTVATYQSVLRNCLDVTDNDEYEKAGLVALDIGHTLSRDGLLHTSNISSLIQACSDRLPADSLTKQSLNKLLD